jgi:hypothetical protein
MATVVADLQQIGLRILCFQQFFRANRPPENAYTNGGDHAGDQPHRWRAPQPITGDDTNREGEGGEEHRLASAARGLA